MDFDSEGLSLVIGAKVRLEPAIGGIDLDGSIRKLSGAMFDNPIEAKGKRSTVRLPEARRQRR